MRFSISNLRFLICLLVPACAAHAAAPIPADKRIVATTLPAVSAPADQPMHMPTAVAIDSHGRVFVADGANDRIVQFSAEGKFERSLAQFGEQKLSRPVGLKIDSADHLWIADTGNRRILVADADGKLLQTIDVPPTESGKLAKPTDVAITSDGKRTYIIDTDNHRLLVRDNATGKIASEGKFGRAIGQFQWPFMACIGVKDYVYLTEAIGARVQGLSPQDRWSGEIGQWGMQLGQFYRPKGIAADATGRLFISDSTTRVIQVFDADGGIKGVLTDAEGKLLRFAHPMGMCFDRAGRLYVVELEANRVAIVKLQEAAKP